MCQPGTFFHGRCYVTLSDSICNRCFLNFSGPLLIIGFFTEAEFRETDAKAET